MMLDADLVETKALNQAVKRNLTRFPEDFMFRLTAGEKQEVVTNRDHLARLEFSPALPHAVTEAWRRDALGRAQEPSRRRSESRRGEGLRQDAPLPGDPGGTRPPRGSAGRKPKQLHVGRRSFACVLLRAGGALPSVGPLFHGLRDRRQGRQFKID
ncbi:MAG: ORF6N domain-containing protein, partial [Candidatus Sericytochromatia bacterium]|nr:ORF6N domain-containing protein [Candidatus Tanganyikabacteria bacterium]